MRTTSLKTCVRLLMLVVALGGLAYYVKLNASDFDAISNLSVGLIVGLWALHCAMFLLTAIPILAVAKAFGLEIKIGRWMQIYAYSRVLSTFAPQIATAYRIAELKLSHRYSIAAHIAALAVFVFLNRIFTFLLAFITVLATDPSLMIGDLKVVQAMLSIGAIGIFIASIVVALHGCLGGQISKALSRINRPTYLMDIAHVLSKPKLLTIVLFWTSLGFGLSLLAHALLFNAIGSELGIGEAAVLRVFRSVLDIVPLTPGNIGVSEAMYGALTAGMASSAAEGILVSAILTTVSTTSVATAYLVFLLLGRIRSDDRAG